MSPAIQFLLFWGCLLAFLFLVGTYFYLQLVGDGIDCPQCGAAETLRLQSRGWRRVVPEWRDSWCPECGWRGLRLVTPQADAASVNLSRDAIANTDSQSGQLPLKSKKSSK